MSPLEGSLVSQNPSSCGRKWNIVLLPQRTETTKTRSSLTSPWMCVRRTSYEEWNYNRAEGKNFKDGIWNDKQIGNVGVSQLEKREKTATRDVISVGQVLKFISVKAVWKCRRIYPEFLMCFLLKADRSNQSSQVTRCPRHNVMFPADNAKGEKDF